MKKPEQNTAPDVRVVVALVKSSDSDAVVAALKAPGLEVESQAASPDILKIGGANVAVLDIDAFSPDDLANLRARHPETAIAVTASDPSVEMLQKLLRIGVQEFIPGRAPTPEIAAAVKALCERTILNQVHIDAFSRRRVNAVPADEEKSRGAARTEQLQNVNKTLKQQVSQLTILYQMGRDISENENWSDALDRFLMALVNYLSADGAALLLFSDEENRLRVRSNFQVDPPILSQSCQVLVENWQHNPRGQEIHTIESYRDANFVSALENTRGWKYTIIPLRHRNRSLGFLMVEKDYRSNLAFTAEYHFLNTIQTILAEEVANAVYISELRQLSRFNKKVIDNINSGVVTTDLDGNVLFYNELAARMCPLLDNGGIHFDRLFHSERFGDAIYQRIIGGEKDTYVVEAECVGRDDHHFPARVSITKMHDDNLNGTVLVAIFEDLTEQRRLQTEVRRNDRLRVLGQLSAGVAHEIRNPLTGIATSAEVLGSKIDETDEKKPYIRAILDEIRRLDGIIRNLLDFARPAKPQLGRCVLPEVSERVVNLLGEQARKRSIDVSVIDELVDESCQADPDQVTQLLMNMVLNSIQACDDGGSVKIVLGSDAESMGNGFARIDVIDDGVGVPPDVRASLFEPFVTTKTSGTGLGLAISQQIVEEHNGEIECEFLDKGTRFSIRLPLRQDTQIPVDSTR